jgi:hypothetical protein
LEKPEVGKTQPGWFLSFAKSSRDQARHGIDKRLGFSVVCNLPLRKVILYLHSQPPLLQGGVFTW